MKSLMLDFLKVTESAAMAAIPWIGSGDKIKADGAATYAMRKKLNEMCMDGKIVIGEGEIDEAPMLFIGEKLGTGDLPEIDIAVDPIEGTTPTVNGQSNAITVIAAAPKGALLHAPDMYMMKLAVGPAAKGHIDIDAPLSENIKKVAGAKGKEMNELHVLIQDRPRHQRYVDEIRQMGAKVHLFKDGDVIYETATCLDHLEVDLFLGIGGAPEGVLGAVAIKGLGGEMQGKLLPRSDAEYARCMEMGLHHPEAKLTHHQLVSTDKCIFAATGITENMFLKGIQSYSDCHVTHSILIDGTERQFRLIESKHKKHEREGSRV
ncbi:class II fructose-bisphosphatase [Halobacillus ihumii]|uniref:class II fructose-bisphosphatase n=1 Tax=Halobacillus ihumii TaxID=2686092 RepID=UPI0013D2DBA1|nr:class II fructose-bisphosphatase [Halobacillus ihumii]